MNVFSTETYNILSSDAMEAFGMEMALIIPVGSVIGLKGELGTGKNAEWVYKGAQDATEFFNKNSNNSVELHKSYELDWLKEKFKTIS